MNMIFRCVLSALLMLAAMTSSVILCGCGGDADITADPSAESSFSELTPPASDSVIYPVSMGAAASVEVEVDGEDERITVRALSVGGNVLWERYAGMLHSEWRGIYLHDDGSEQHILIWQPYTSQGMSYFSYELLTFDGSGEVTVLDSDALSFVMGEEPEAYAAFIAKVNGYLEKSVVLADTVDARFLSAPLDSEERLAAEKYTGEAVTVP